MKCLLSFLFVLYCFCTASAQTIDSLPKKGAFYEMDSLSKEIKLKEILALIPTDSLYNICKDYLATKKDKREVDRDTIDSRKPEVDGYAAIEWEALYFDFGNVITDTIMTKTITFSNTGTQPLLIQNIKTSCGCTVMDYPKSPILPAQSSEIKVHFESKNRLGPSEQVLIVYDNTPQRRTILKFKVQVFSR